MGVECETLLGYYRLAPQPRRTICFSKYEEMHDLVIGLFLNHLISKHPPLAPTLALD